ncbi:MAG: histidine kinase [Leptolyngbyaceae cyanobacterium bins.302]|nr:histidine kinase [Leptolyngbyaceae cyanobacterium bins.302]
MQVSFEQNPNADTPLQLLLFVDKRPSSREQVRQVRSELKELREVCDFELQTIDVTEQPYLAEYFRLIATPALIKIHPEPRQVLAGSDLVGQLRQWWSQWQRSVDDYLARAEQALSEEAEAETVLMGAPNPMQLADIPLEITSDSIAEVAKQDDAPQETIFTTKSTDRADQTEASLKSVSHSVEQIRLTDEIFRLRREKEELQHQLQFKDQIISMLAHDLRNPLTATSIALETLEMGYNSANNATSRLTPALTLQLLKHARTQTRAIDRMITDILQAARGTGAELQIRPQKLNLGRLCRDVIAYMDERLKAKSLQLEKDIPSDLPTVLADEERIRQVLINLLDNAIKYTPIGGTIQLSALHRTTQKIQISVCDNGPGIPTENQERIFEEHYRLKRDEDKDGYGIGLSLCQRIIRAHYGRIWVDSTANQGSCFHFTLPVFQA